MMNRSVIDEVVTERIQMSDTTMPLLRIWYTHRPTAAEVPTLQIRNATITITKDGGGSSKLRVAIKVNKVDENGTASTDADYTYDGVTGGSGTVTAVTETLGELVDKLNAIPNLKAVRLNAPADYSLATDDFITAAEADIQPKPMDVLYKDVSEIYTTAVRIGVPEPQDSGRIRLIKVEGTVTGATNGTITISRDPTDGEGGASDEEILDQKTLVNTTRTAYVDDKMDDASVYRGPILIEVTSDNLTACDILVKYMQSEW